MWSRVRLTKVQTTTDQITCGQKYGRKLVKPLRLEKNKNGKTRSQNSTMLEDWEEFTLSILMTKIIKKILKTREESWNDPCPQPCRAKEKLRLAPRRSCEAGNCIAKDSQNDLWLYCGISRIHKATSGIFSTQKNTKIALQAKVPLRWPITIWFSNLFLCSKRWKFRMQKLQWTRNGESLRQSQHGNWRKSRARRRLFSKHKEIKRKSTLFHWWTYVSSKTRS